MSTYRQQIDFAAGALEAELKDAKRNLVNSEERNNEKDKIIASQSKRIIELEQGAWAFLEEYGIKHIKGDLLLDERPKLSIVLSCGSTLQLHPRGR